MIDITIDNKWNITSDSMQFILGKIHTMKTGKNAGEKKIIDRSYHTNMGDLLNNLFFREMLESDAKKIQDIQLDLRRSLLAVKNVANALKESQAPFYASRREKDEDDPEVNTDPKE